MGYKIIMTRFIGDYVIYKPSVLEGGEHSGIGCKGVKEDYRYAQEKW